MFTVPLSLSPVNTSTTNRSQNQGAQVQKSPVVQDDSRVEGSAQVQNGEHE